MASHRKLFQLVFIGLILLFACLRPTAAQTWSHGNYTVDQVIDSVGNFIYSAGANNGSLSVQFPPTGVSASICTVRFAVTWTCSGPPPWSGTLNYKGDLSGSAGTGSTATTEVSTNDDVGGKITKTTSSNGNPFSFTGLTCLMRSVSTTPIIAKIVGSARVDRGTGSSGSAAATVYTSM